MEDLCKSIPRGGQDHADKARQAEGRRERWQWKPGHIDRHIIPLLGSRKVPSVTRRDIEKFQDQIAAGATKVTVKTKKRGKAVVKGGKGTAARCLNTLGAIFAYAVKLGIRDDNPVHGVVRFQGNAVKKFLSPDEMKALGKAIADAEAGHPQAAAIIRLLAMTGARRNEIAHLQWSWVDLHHGVLRLPNSKTGERLIVLGQAARDLIARVTAPQWHRSGVPADPGWRAV